MNIYLLSQSKNKGYDTYDSCVVLAETEEEARKIFPKVDDEANVVWSDVYQCWVEQWYTDEHLEDGIMKNLDDEQEYVRSMFGFLNRCWARPTETQVSLLGVAYLGIAATHGVVCASYNAG